MFGVFSNPLLIASIHPLYWTFFKTFMNILRSHLICITCASGHNICWQLANSLQSKMGIEVANYNYATLVHRKCSICRRQPTNLSHFPAGQSYIIA